MKTRYLQLMTLAAVMILAVATLADAGSLRGKTRLELGVGFSLEDDRHDFYFDGQDIWERNTDMDGAVVSIGISHWVQSNVALTASWSLLDMKEEVWHDVDNWRIEDREFVHSVLFGVRSYFPQRERHPVWRPYLAASIGSYIGTWAYEEKSPCECEYYEENRSMHKFGGRLGGGVDIQLGRSFMMGVDAGYNFMSDFDRPILSKDNYGGPDMRFSIGLLL